MEVSDTIFAVVHIVKPSYCSGEICLPPVSSSCLQVGYCGDIYLFKYVSVIKYAFNLMINTKWTLTFVVLNNIVMLNDCASAPVKLSEALEDIVP